MCVTNANEARKRNWHRGRKKETQVQTRGVALDSRDHFNAYKCAFISSALTFAQASKVFRPDEFTSQFTTEHTQTVVRAFESVSEQEQRSAEAALEYH